MVTVARCEPNCTAPQAWAILGSDGAVRLSLLRPEPGASKQVPTPVAELFEYGRVGPAGIIIYKKADLHAPILSHRPINREMVFRLDPELRAHGWLARMEGGYVRVRSVDTLKSSPFQGEAQPRLPLVFVTRELATTPAKGSSEDRLHRYDRLPIIGVDKASVLTERGSIRRKDVRMIALQAPPPSLPAGGKWVQLDLAEQTLTAYEGAKPVFATLISSGKTKDKKAKQKTETRPGLYQVEHKLIYDNMNGESEDPYAVDRVPYVQYFHNGDALHGAYWHDLFGAAVSHGCVNLSLADAAWLFAWAPPQLPAGWSAVEARDKGAGSLWVWVVPQAAPPISASDPAAPAPSAMFLPVRRRNIAP